ncbi:MAG: carboxymuconolactone decarboxylase family protein [Pseudomonadota bacterium]
MVDFTIHDTNSAPEDGKPLLEKSQKAYGMIPNLHGVFAESPELLEAYQVVGDLFGRSSLSDVDRNVVWMSINVENNCHYCVPAHSMIAKQQGVDDATIEALRNAEPLADPKLEALRAFSLKVVRQRGDVNDSDVEAFLNAGFTKRNILDVILGVAHKTMSNYTNHLAGTPVDEPFKTFDWTPTGKKAAA